MRAAGGRISFRFGVMSDEFIGRARYSEKRWPYGNLGGNADDFRPLGDGSFFVSNHNRFAAVRAEIGWHREKRSSSHVDTSLFYLQRKETL